MMKMLKQIFLHVCFTIRIFLAIQNLHLSHVLFVTLITVKKRD